MSEGSGFFGRVIEIFDVLVNSNREIRTWHSVARASVDWREPVSRNHSAFLYKAVGLRLLNGGAEPVATYRITDRTAGFRCFQFQRCRFVARISRADLRARQQCDAVAFDHHCERTGFDH